MEKPSDVRINIEFAKAEARMKTFELVSFYRAVCALAERTIAETGKLEGAHYNAMRTILNEMLYDIGEKWEE